jgi:hypothetical protein
VVLVLALRVCGRETSEDVPATAIQERRRVVPPVAPETETHRHRLPQRFGFDRLVWAAVDNSVRQLPFGTKPFPSG